MRLKTVGCPMMLSFWSGRGFEKSKLRAGWVKLRDTGSALSAKAVGSPGVNDCEQRNLHGRPNIERRRAGLVLARPPVLYSLSGCGRCCAARPGKRSKDGRRNIRYLHGRRVRLDEPAAPLQRPAANYTHTQGPEGGSAGRGPNREAADWHGN